MTTDPPAAPPTPRRSKVARFAVGGLLFTGIISFPVGFFLLSKGNVISPAICLMAAALAFSPLVNLTARK